LRGSNEKNWIINIRAEDCLAEDRSESDVGPAAEVRGRWADRSRRCCVAGRVEIRPPSVHATISEFTEVAPPYLAVQSTTPDLLRRTLYSYCGLLLRQRQNGTITGISPEFRQRGAKTTPGSPDVETHKLLCTSVARITRCSGIHPYARIFRPVGRRLAYERIPTFPDRRLDSDGVLALWIRSTE
jgi:hypothetical protein